MYARDANELRDNLMQIESGDQYQLHDGLIIACELIAAQQAQIDKLIERLDKVNSIFPSTVIP